MNKNVLITLKKELRGILRDKKYLAIMLLTPLIIPFMVFMMGFIQDFFTTETSVGINYKLNNNEKSIINEIDEIHKVNYIEEKTIDELKEMYENGDITAYVLKEEKDGKDNYTIYADESNTTSMSALSGVQAYLSGYNNFLANNYLVGEDIDPDNVFNYIKINIEDLAEEGQNYMSTMIISMVLSYLVMIIITTAVSTSVDIVVGEKERGTLETILTFPITSTELIIGKYLAITLACIITSFIGISLTIPAFYISKMMFDSYADISINLGLPTILLSVLILLLTSLLASGLCIALSGGAKNYKEGQSKLSMLSFLPLISMFLTISGGKTNIFFSLIPIANSGILLNDLFLKNISLVNILAMLISTIIYIIIIIKFISLQYKNEKTLF